MPVYIYQNPKTEEIIEIVQSIDEKHEYIDEYKVKWNRIFTVPQLNTEGSLNADCDSKKFVEFTRNKKGTIGDLWDRSAELSEKRRKIYGKDPVKQDYKAEWSKKRRGRKFLDE